MNLARITWPFLAAAVLLSMGLNAADRLAETYRKGRIRLVADPDFARGTDWESLFQDRHRILKTAPDGSVFISNNRDHSVYKFDASGSLVLKFGRHGQGPGDFNHPGFLSILDDDTLVVGDDAQGRRISLFRLNGEFRAVLKTRFPPFRPTALRNGKIAYIGRTSGPGKFEDGVFLPTDIFRVVIIDAGTGTEREVESFTSSLNDVRDGAYVIARSGEGDLLVGVTTSPEIRIYDPDGRKRGTINLKMNPIRVTKPIAEAHQVKVAMVKAGKRESFSYPLGEFLPYYSDFAVDSAGNIVVFKLGENPKTGPVVIRAISPSGEVIGDAEIDLNGFDYSPDRRFPRLEFTNRGIFGILPLKGDEMETPRLFRVRITS